MVARSVMLLLAAMLVAATMAVGPAWAGAVGNPGDGEPNPTDPPGKSGKKCEKVDKPAHVMKCHKRR